jgi:hypothetical protein
MARPIYNCDKTEYPEIFGRTYWGAFKYNHEVDDIIENRNDFIKKYNIKNKRPLKDKLWQMFSEEKKRTNLDLDHLEVYNTNDNKLIAITSPFKHVNPSDFEKEGWTSIYPLYYEEAYTFLKEVDPKTFKFEKKII